MGAGRTRFDFTSAVHVVGFSLTNVDVEPSDVSRWAVLCIVYSFVCRAHVRCRFECLVMKTSLLLACC